MVLLFFTFLALLNIINACIDSKHIILNGNESCQE
jgi:hypothetical protein